MNIFSDQRGLRLTRGINELASVETRYGSIEGQQGEDSRCIHVPVFSDFFVAKIPLKIRLSEEEIQNMDRVAEFYQIPLHVMQVKNTELDEVSGTIVCNKRILPLSKLLSNDSVINRSWLFTDNSHYRDSQKLETVNYFFDQKILLLHQGIAHGFIADVDMCNVGFNPDSRRVELFDFAGARFGINIHQLVEGSGNTLEKEAELLSEITYTRMDELTPSMMYRLIRFRDCYVASTIFSADSSFKKEVWNKYQLMEAQLSSSNSVFIAPVNNPFYKEQQEQLERFCGYYEKELKEALPFCKFLFEKR